jgi:hypothetical protein
MNAKAAQEVWADGPRKLKGHLPRSGGTQATGCFAVMAVPFLGISALVILFMLGVIGDGSIGDDMPLAVALLFGGGFGAAGLWLLVSGIQGERRERRLRQARRLHPDEPWRWEFPAGNRIEDDARQRTLSAFIFPILWFAFVIPFHLVFGLDVTVILMDLAGALVLAQAIYVLVRYLRFGRSELELGRVPFFQGEMFEAELLPTRALARLERVTVTLHCVEERTETSGSGKQRRHEVNGYELYAVTEQLDTHVLGDGGSLKLRFQLPSSPAQLGTALHERPSRYWELVVKSELKGVDYQATFLVPIYAPARRHRKR